MDISVRVNIFCCLQMSSSKLSSFISMNLWIGCSRPYCSWRSSRCGWSITYRRWDTVLWRRMCHKFLTSQSSAADGKCRTERSCDTGSSKKPYTGCRSVNEVHTYLWHQGCERRLDWLFGVLLPFPNKRRFLLVCSTSLFKTIWEKGNLS